MTDYILKKPTVIAKERKIMIEFVNSAASGTIGMLMCEVVETERSKTDLSKYSVVLSADLIEEKIKVPAETFLYQLTSTRKIKLNENVKYRRNNIWEVEFFIKNQSVSVKIKYFDEVIQAVYSILKRNFQFFSEVFETYEYLYFPQLFNVYKKSYDNAHEVCEKFYEVINNKLKTRSFEEFIDVCKDLQSALENPDAKKSEDMCDCFVDCVKNAIPHHFSRYVLAEYFEDSQILDCYGGKDNALEYLERVLGKSVDINSDTMMPLLKKLTFDKDNKQFNDRIYMKHLLETIAAKSQELFMNQKQEWQSYSDMIYNTVSKLMRREKDKTTT